MEEVEAEVEVEVEVGVLDVDTCVVESLVEAVADVLELCEVVDWVLADVVVVMLIGGTPY